MPIRAAPERVAANGAIHPDAAHDVQQADEFEQNQTLPALSGGAGLVASIQVVEARKNGSAAVVESPRSRAFTS
jgi:hypothetical protein